MAEFKSALEWLDEIERKPKEDYLCSVDEKYITVNWGNYEWWTETNRIKTPLNAIGLMDHLMMKQWEHTTVSKVRFLFQQICKVKGWDMHPF